MTRLRAPTVLLPLLALAAALSAQELPPYVNHSLGTQRVLVVQVSFTDRAPTALPTPERVQQVQDGMNNYLLNDSYGRTALRIDEVVAVPLPYGKDDKDYAQQAYDAMNILRQRDAARYADAAWNRVWFINCTNLGSTGRGELGGQKMWIGFDSSGAAGGYAKHELMHTYGLDHVGGGAWSGGSRFFGLNVPYLDGGIGGANPAGSKIAMGWLVKDDPNGFGFTDLPLTASSSGVYRISLVDSTQAIPGGTRALRLPRMALNNSRLEGDYYAFSLKREVLNGLAVHRVFDMPAPPTYRTASRNPVRCLSRPWLGDGAERLGFPIGRTIALVQPGEGYFVTPLTAIPAANGLPEAIDVDVRIGPFPGNRAPTAALAASASAVGVGELVRFTVTAADADGDALAYHWEFGDNLKRYALTSALLPEVTKSWAAPGRYRVQATVSDRKGGARIVATTITVGTPVGYRIAGRARTASGVAAQGMIAWVTLPNDQCAYGYTDAEGRYELTNLPAGSHQVNLGGLETGFSPLEGQRTVTVNADLADIDFVVIDRPAGGQVVSGAVREAGTDAAINEVQVSDGVNVAITGADGNGNGRFELSGVPMGPATLTGRHPFYDIAPQTLTVTTGYISAPTLVATKRPTTEVRGRVVDGSGAPLKGVKFRVDYLNTGMAATNDAGAYSGQFPRGRITLRPVSGGWTFSPATRTIDVGTVPVTGVDFVAIRMASISGSVTYGGTGLKGVVVTAGGRSLVVDDNGGRWSLNVPLGPVTVRYALAGYAFSPNDVALTVDAAGVSGLTSVATYVETARRISGTISGPGAAPLAGATISTGSISVVSGSDGRYALVTNVERNPLQVSLAGYATVTRTVTAARDVDGQDFTLTPTGPTAPSITSQPANLTIAAGQQATFAVGVGGSPTPAVRWQRRSSASASWADIGGATSSSYTFTAALADNGAQFRAVATNSANSATSNAATLTVTAANTAPTISALTNVTTAEDTATPAQTLTVADAETAAGSLIVTATSSDTALIPNASIALGGSGGSRTVAVTPAKDRNGSATITVTVSDGSLSAIRSFVVTVTPVNDAPVCTAVPTISGTVKIGATLTASTGTWNDSADGGSIAGYAWQWQRADDASGTNTVAISGATGSTYVLAAADLGKRIRVQVTATDSGTPTPALSASARSVWSAAVTAGDVAPAFTTQPANVAVYAGQTATFTVAVTGTPAPTLQWQRQASGASTWTNIGGATGTSYAFTAALADNGAKFRILASNSVQANVASIAATLTVTASPSFAAKVNFQPASAPAYGNGYVIDAGATYAARNGLTYGWNVDRSAATRDRNDARSADQRADTLIHLQSLDQTGVWEIAVPNGDYQVTAVCGDPSYTDSVYRLSVEGVVLVNGTPSDAQRWISGTGTVQVSDGKLTITPASGGVNVKLCEIVIASVPSGVN